MKKQGMPEEEHKLRIFILHAPEDNLALQNNRPGYTSEFVRHLTLALGAGDHKIDLSSEAQAGTEEEERIADAIKSDLVVYILSASFFHNSFCFDCMNEVEMEARRNGLRRVALFLENCTIDKWLGSDIEVYPGINEFVVGNVRNMPTLFKEAGEAMVAFLENKPKPAVKPDLETLRLQRKTLAEALDHLNYVEQPRDFKKLTIFQNKVLPLAFLIHGDLRGLGAEWLFAKLLRSLPEKNPRIIRASVDRADTNIYDNGFISEVAHYFELPKDASYENLRDKIFSRLTTTSVTYVLRFDAMRNILRSAEQKAFEAFRQRLWDPLVEAVANSPEAQQSKARLIAFFVAHENMDDCPHFVPYNEWQPSVPLRLKKVDPFGPKLIGDWLDDHGHLLNQLPSIKPKALLQLGSRPQKIAEILAKSQNGLPEMVLQHICRECACDFEDMIKMLFSHETED